MSLIPLVLDCAVPYGRGSSRPVSLLTLPLGTGTVLDHIAERLEKVGNAEILVLSDDLQPSDPVFERSGALPIRPVTSEILARELERYEASDYLLVVDPRLWPARGHDFVEAQHMIERYRGATHLIAVGGSRESLRERVERDASGDVRRIQRLYTTKSWSEVNGSNIICSIVPLRVAIGLRFVFPMELRAGLAGIGVLSQDVPLDCDVFRLGVKRGFLALTDQSLGELCGRPAVEGFRVRAPAVLVGRDCRIGPGARLVGPILIQPGATIEDQATVIGPTVIGAGSRIMRGATVIQSALARNTIVPPEATVRHQVACGEYPDAEEEASGSPCELKAAASIGSEQGRIEPSDCGTLVQGRGRAIHFAVKRGIDIVASALALLVLSPLLLLVAVAVRLDSRGPLFFSHRREGRWGREFPCWKFRTMVADAHQQQRRLYEKSEVDGPQFKIRNDPRVTRVGRWLRSTNIDELPQLFNVLLGHMSLVGPRPSPFRENQICVPWRRARLSVTPGITGLWQVCRDGDRLKGDFHEWIFYDMTYVRHFSIWLDLKILLATVVTLGGRWGVPLGWLLPKVAQDRDVYRYSVSAA